MGQHQPAYAGRSPGEVGGPARSANNPNTGPAARSHGVHSRSPSHTAAVSWIEKRVMKNPMLFCTARADPTASGGHAFADMAENCGESATTKKPHTANRASAAHTGTCGSAGDSTHISPEPARAVRATTKLPRRRLTRPPTTHPTAPAAITENVASEPRPISPTRNGTSAQNAYSSHMC